MRYLFTNSSYFLFISNASLKNYSLSFSNSSIFVYKGIGQKVICIYPYSYYGYLSTLIIEDFLIDFIEDLIDLIDDLIVESYLKKFVTDVINSS